MSDFFHKLLLMNILANLLFSCKPSKEQFFAAEAPVKNNFLTQPFPTDLVYQKSPNGQVIIGKRKIEPAIFEISAFEKNTAKEVWKLPFLGEIVGQTSTQLVVYEEKTNSVHFVNPSNGVIERTVSPAPTPLSSKTGFEYGMAFTDEMYLTTKSLYAQVIENGKIDTTWHIGLTAKKWNSNEKVWFLPPVTQIIILKYRPIIFEDKVLIINDNGTINSGQSYQIISLTTGKELQRNHTKGTFYWFKGNNMIEHTKDVIKLIDPFQNKTLWQTEGSFDKPTISVLGNQLSIIAPYTNGSRAVQLIDIQSGKLLKKFDLAINNADIVQVFNTKNHQVLLHLQKPNYAVVATNEFDYWVCYDTKNQKALWRSDFHSESLGSLMTILK